MSQKPDEKQREREATGGRGFHKSLSHHEDDPSTSPLCNVLRELCVVWCAIYHLLWPLQAMMMADMMQSKATHAPTSTAVSGVWFRAKKPSEGTAKTGTQVSLSITTPSSQTPN